MKYVVRLNPKAFNPLTKQVIPDRLWEIEQCANRDSEKVIWHAGEVRIDGVPMRELFKLPEPGGKPWELECFGFCVRGQDNAIEIRTRRPDASGN